MALCPVHDDHRPSLSLADGDDGRALLKCMAGCSTEQVLAKLGLDWDVLGGMASQAKRDELVAAYPYLDEEGELLYEVVRYSPKAFKQRRPDGKGGHLWNLNGTRRVLYHLPRLMDAVRAARTIYVCEGEKDVEAIERAGGVATCNSGGAGKWRDTYSESLAGAQVVIVADNDTPGLAHAKQVASSLTGRTAGVRIVVAKVGKDASDHLAAGHSLDDFLPLEGLGSPPDVRLVRMSEVTPEEVTWLWPARIPQGKLTNLVGGPGLGKSFITLYVASCVTRGLEWPDGGWAPAGDVILLTAEDGLADTVRPRLDRLGADVTRVSVLEGVTREGSERPFSLLEDVARLETAVQSRQAVLVIIDPLNAYLRGVDAHKAAEVRGALAPVARMAERTGAAVLVVHHLNKGSATNALYRASGSLDFVAAARSVMGVAPDPQTDGRVLLFPVKLNIAAKPVGIGFRVGEHGIVWDKDPVAYDLASVFSSGAQTPEDRSQLDEAKDFLVELLSAGPVPAREMAQQAEDAGIAERTLRRARRALGLVSLKDGFHGGWAWRLPDDSKVAKPSEDGQPPDVANFDDVGQLRCEEQDGRGAVVGPCAT
jgi:5S rRNA maturation endonuclease (ribonuclease M5)